MRLRTALAILALTLAAVAVVVVVAFAALTPVAERFEFASPATDEPVAMPDFTLTAHTGEPFTLSDYRGKVVALYFGYTHCPDICPTTLATYYAVRQALPEELRDDLQVVMVTVDPERDTVEWLASYMPGFDPSFIGVTGEPEDVRAVMRAWGVVRERGEVAEDGSYFLAHTAYVHILDRDGLWRLITPFGMSVEDITSDIHHLLEED